MFSELLHAPFTSHIFTYGYALHLSIEGPYSAYKKQVGGIVESDHGSAICYMLINNIVCCAKTSLKICIAS